MSFVATAIAASTIGGALITSNASRGAAQTQADAANKASQTQLDMFNQNKADLAPWLQSGQLGNQELMRLLGLGGTAQNPTFNPNAQLVRPFGMADFQQDPGYQFRFQQGENALLNARSALGGLQSGNTLKALTDYGQGMGSQEYQNAFNRYNVNNQNIYNRLGGIANSGQNAAGMTAGLGANVASQIGQNTIGAGNALAAGQVGVGNAINSGIGGLSNQWLQANALQQQGGGQWDYNSMLQGPQQIPGWVSQG